MSYRILVAGLGNIFLGDDGFGVEVAQRLASKVFSDRVRIADFGIRGVHLAYELLEERYETAILIDASARGGKPGTLYVIEPETDVSDLETASAPDAHSMHPEAVLALLKTLGGAPGRIVIVGCEPASLDEGIGLSAPVAAAVEPAMSLVQEIIEQQDNGRRSPL